MATEAIRLADRLAGLRPTAINTILGEVRSLRAQGREIVSLMRGEPDFPTPAHITEAATTALARGRTSYPDNRGELTLREAIASKLQRDNGVRYDPASEILVTDGATLGIHATLMSVLQSGNEILVPDPIYDAYQSAIHLSGAQARRVRSERGNGGRFAINLEALKAACTPRSRALLLNTPWNPVGSVFTAAELTEISDFALGNDLTIVSDEIYEAITYDNHRHLSPAALSPEVRERCIVVNSLSKPYSMTGWRLGYCAAPAHVIQAMLLVLQQSSRGPATFVQDAGVAALAGPQDCVANMRSIYAGRRTQVSNTLSGLPHVEVLSPEGGFSTMLDISGLRRSSDEVRRNLLKEYGVAVVHGRAYGECGEGTLRVAFASGGETLNAGLSLLREGLQRA